MSDAQARIQELTQTLAMPSTITLRYQGEASAFTVITSYSIHYTKLYESGIGWHLVGAASAASFYAPISKVRQWSWETTWAFAGLFSWILLPWIITSLLIDDFGSFYSVVDSKAFWGMFLFGAMWGVGNVNYGLTMRYLGMSLGIGIAIGVTLVVGTLMPPILRGEFGHLLTTSSGQITLLGVVV